MPYREYKGNIFASKAQVLVNTVNCVGVMGKGVALEFRHRYPRMFEDYKRKCNAKLLRPGQILPYRQEKPWILNFAVKDDWRNPSKMEWVESCLTKFAQSYKTLKIRSVAMPWIGAMNGQLPWHEVHALMRFHLKNLPDIDIEVVEFDPTAPDPLFETLKRLFNETNTSEIVQAADISSTVAIKIGQAIHLGMASSLADILALNSVGMKSVERLYDFLRRRSDETENVALLQSKLL